MLISQHTFDTNNRVVQHGELKVNGLIITKEGILAHTGGTEESSRVVQFVLRIPPMFDGGLTGSEWSIEINCPQHPARQNPEPVSLHPSAYPLCA